MDGDGFAYDQSRDGQTNSACRLDQIGGDRSTDPGDRWLAEAVAAFCEMKRTVQVLLAVSICIALSACSRAHPSNLDAAQIRAKLDAIPLDQKVDLTNKEW